MSTNYIVYLDNGIKLEMVYIPGGSFVMGSPEYEEGRDYTEGPQHKVTLRPFYMGMYPITQEQYQAIMGKNPSQFQGRKRPVGGISWFDTVDFCRKLSYKTGVKFSLPSESQWEYACRAGTTTPFNFGKNITSELANYNSNYPYGNGPTIKAKGEPTDVGIFSPNSFGLYDMHGNVWEWCEDVWHNKYVGAPTDGSAWVDSYSSYRVLRGGFWLAYPSWCRSANRSCFFYYDGSSSIDIGLRVVCDGGRG